MTNFLERMFGKVFALRKEEASRQNRRRTLRRSMQFESLQKRECFSVDFSLGVTGPVNHQLPNTLFINSDNASDNVSIEWNPRSNDVFDDDLVLRVNGNSGTHINYSQGYEGNRDVHIPVFIETIIFHGNGGNDTFFVKGNRLPFFGDKSQTINILAFGEGGNDKLEGANGSDQLMGGKGDDILIGHEADDLLDGGDDQDILWGDEMYQELQKQFPEVYQSGINELSGGFGNDFLYGGEIADRMEGGLGNDLLDGRSGGDTLYGDYSDFGLHRFSDPNAMARKGGNDELHGGYGDDVLVGNNGIDSLYGELGNDTMYGDAIDPENTNEVGNDYMVGGDNSGYNAYKEKDTMYGGRGNDTMLGGDGDDKIYGNAGNDKLFGGNDQDRVYGGDGNDEIFGGRADDTLDGGKGNDYMWGDEGNDVMYGGEDNDTMFGADGADFMLGEGGNDMMYGLAGGDYMDGGEGSDSMWGGIGNDTMDGSCGFDLMFGELGDDTLDGGQDGIADFLFGGSGKDKFKTELKGVGVIKNIDRPFDLNFGEGDLYF